MLEPIKHLLESQNIVLASSSPRRHKILRNLGLTFSVVPSTYEEDLDWRTYANHQNYVIDTARHKVHEVGNRPGFDADIIIGADTAVIVDGEVFGKPSDEKHAFEMLTRLSGRWHKTITGVVIRTRKKQVEFCETVGVCFGSLTPDMINGYISTGQPMDKAGGYGVEGLGGSLITCYDGDYFTVMGLPAYMFCKYMTRILTEA